MLCTNLGLNPCARNLGVVLTSKAPPIFTLGWQERGGGGGGGGGRINGSDRFCTRGAPPHSN